MLLKDTIDILAPTQTQDAKGRLISAFAFARSIKCDFQPLKYSTLYKPYGITDKTSHVMFCKDKGITALNRIWRSDGSLFIVNSILAYRNHVEVYLEKVISPVKFNNAVFYFPGFPIGQMLWL